MIETFSVIVKFWRCLLTRMSKGMTASGIKVTIHLVSDLSPNTMTVYSLSLVFFFVKNYHYHFMKTTIVFFFVKSKARIITILSVIRKDLFRKRHSHFINFL